MPSYLQKRRRRYYAVMEIPKALRPRFGNKRRFVQSLETDSRARAEQRVLHVVSAWKGQIESAKGDDGDMWWEPIPSVVRGRTFSRPPVSAKELQRALRNAKTEEERQAVLHEIEMTAWDIGSVNVENVGDPPSSDPEAQRFAAIATGALVQFIEHLDEWMATSRATAKTQDMQRSDVRRFAAKFPTVQDVTR
ncbi:MAG: hypothetical protein IH905_09440, partial [Proteobacteria bacterium]|nr:hypothetical protein [Pseudomonadota bacterium]